MTGSYVLGVNFINPTDDETNAQLMARRDGDGIAMAMEGKLSGGAPIRWRFRAIMPTSFPFTAERRNADAEPWQLYLELFGKRSVKGLPRVVGDYSFLIA